MIDNRTKVALVDGGFSIGAGVIFCRNPALLRVIAAAGYDFALIDMQHAGLNYETVTVMCEMARAAGVTPIVRPYSKSPEIGNKIADLGVMGIMLPDVQTRAEVDTALDWMLYPPRGSRGAYFGPPFDYRAGGPTQEAMARSNDNMMLVIQIESRAAVESIDEILGDGGVDVVEIGRYDLGNSYGVGGDKRHPVVLDAVDKVIAACQRQNVPVGAGCVNVADAQDMVERGMRFLMYPVDLNLIIDGHHRAAEELRALIGARSV